MHDTYNACFKWLTLRRNSQDLKKLMLAACQCPDGEPSAQAHHSTRDDLASHGRAPFYYLMELVLVPVRDYWKKPGHRPGPCRLDRIRRRRHWPCSIQDILPHGPENTIRSLVYYLTYDLPPGARTCVNFAIQLLVTLCHPLLLGILVSSRIFITRGIVTGLNSHVGQLDSMFASNKIDVYAYADILGSINSLRLLLLDLVTRVCNETQRCAFHRQAPSELITAYERVLDICRMLRAVSDRYKLNTRPDSNMIGSVDRVITDFSLLGGKLFADCQVPLTAEISSDARAKYEEVAQQFRAPYYQVWDRFLRVMNYLEMCQRCATPGCQRTLADAQLKCCMGCQRVLYCSKACQKKAWSHQFPHRDVCAIMARLCATLELPKHEILDRRQAAPNDTAYEPAVLQIVNHFTALAEFDMKTSGCECRPFCYGVADL
jgi:hypothetical protein